MALYLFFQILDRNDLPDFFGPYKKANVDSWFINLLNFSQFLYYMSPELKSINDGNLAIGEFNPELSDIFSLGLSFLRLFLNLKEN